MKKNNTDLILLFILLIFLVIGLISLVIYKGFYVDKQNNITTTTLNTTTTERKETLSDEDLEKYLGYVPFSILHNDAYQNQKVNLNDINKASLLLTVLHNKDVEKVEQTEGCIKEESFNDKLKEMYNLDISVFNSKKEIFDDGEESDYLTFESYLNLKNGCYFENGYGGRYEKSKVKNIEYVVEKNKLVINEQVAIISGHDINIDIYDGSKYIKSYSMIDENGVEYLNYENLAQQYIKDNLSDFNIYKHTFIQREDGTYYWYSTEVEES